MNNQNETQDPEFDPQIERHLQRIRKIQATLKDGDGNLTARVFLRRTGAIYDPDKKSYQIQERDLMEWFENGDHLRSYTEYDTM